VLGAESGDRAGVATVGATGLEATAGTRPAARAPVRIRFHSAIALILTGSMVFGFYFDLPKYVLHPAVHFPAILAVHSAVFVAWLFLYLTQTLLVQSGNIGLHRMLGWFGLALALIMPPLGIGTAIVMRRFDLLHIPSQNVPRDLAFLAAPLADIVAFTPLTWLGIALRKRRDCHSRLMFLSIASIADAGLGRLPIPGANQWFFLTNLALFAAAIVHDRVTIGHVHKVTAWGVTFIVLTEGFSVYLWQWHPEWWLGVCRALTGLG
jgi:hypothetical protein